MRGFTSKTLYSFKCGFRLRIPILKPRTSTIDENGDGGNKTQADRGTDFSESAMTKPPAVSIPRACQVSLVLTRRPQRDRLDGLPNLRIFPTQLTFPSRDPHGPSGGRADVARATYRPENGEDEKVVAVKKVRYRQGVDRRKFENVLDDSLSYSRCLLTSEYV